jgi:hypothetical protein
MVNNMQDDIDYRVDYREPTPEKKERHEMMRASVKRLMRYVSENTPPGREQSFAFTKLEEAMFWANAAIARDERQ